MYRETGCTVGRLGTLLNLALAMAIQGDLMRARALYEEALALARELRLTRGVAGALAGLGGVALDRGEPDEAEARLRESLLLSRQQWDVRGLRGCLEGLASVAGLRRYPTRAARLYGASEALGAAHGLAVDPDVLVGWERHRAAASCARAAAAWTAAWTEGHTMSTEDAVAYALVAEDVPEEGRPGAAVSGAPALQP